MFCLVAKVDPHCIGFYQTYRTQNGDPPIPRIAFPYWSYLAAMFIYLVTRIYIDEYNGEENIFSQTFNHREPGPATDAATHKGGRWKWKTRSIQNASYQRLLKRFAMEIHTYVRGLFRKTPSQAVFYVYMPFAHKEAAIVHII